jgi:hypothetical protein
VTMPMWRLWERRVRRWGIAGFEGRRVEPSG